MLRRSDKSNHRAVVICVNVRIEHAGSWHRPYRLDDTLNRFRLAAFTEVGNAFDERRHGLRSSAFGLWSLVFGLWVFERSLSVVFLTLKYLVRDTKLQSPKD